MINSSFIECATVIELSIFNGFVSSLDNIMSVIYGWTLHPSETAGALKGITL